MRKLPDKAKCQRIHFKTRAAQRYGLVINRHIFRELIEQIQQKRAEFIETQSNRLSVYWVEYQDVRMKVVYDKQRKTLVTALPLHDLTGEIV